MKYNLLPFIIASLFLLTGCGSKGGPDLSPDASRKTIGNVPDWFMNNPEKDGFKYYAATATSRDMQMAIDKAALNAANALAGQMNSEMNALVKRAQEETGLGDDSQIIDQFNKTQEQIISVSLQDYKIKHKDIQSEPSNAGNIYRAYVLIEWDEGAANKRLLAQIKADEMLYTAMRATELFDEMEAKTDAYRQRNQE